MRSTCHHGNGRRAEQAGMKKESMPQLLTQVRACRLCAPHLPHEPRPVVQASASAKLLIIGQAPGRKVHDSGIPWNDASGDRLRDWLQLPRDTFYDASQVAIVPTAFCYP